MPDINKFFSSLKDCSVSEKEYQRAANVWKVFKIKNLGENHELYLKTNVLLLCDMFEKIIKICLEYYCLDPCRYFSSPGLSWDAILKMTGIELQKIDNIDTHLFIEKIMTGYISYISKRYSKSNENKTIMYWNANNLYGCAMIQSLPICDFKFLNKKEIESFNLDSISENSGIGSILECDLEYCKELHDLHNDYPLCTQKIEVSSNMLSKYCSDIVNKYEIKVGGVKKLIPNLGDKIKYVVHYKNLQYYLSLGIKLVKIHRILSFKQSDWVKRYVDFNTEKRKQSTDEFNNFFFKLMINCVYGKSIENIRKTINVRLINDKTTYQRCVNKPHFISQKIFDKNFVAVHCSKTILALNKPIYVGFSIFRTVKIINVATSL